jgi:polyisoprenoid-binding protein YceI
MTITEIEPTTTCWAVDPDRTTVEFAVKSFWGLMTVHGHFERFAGSYKLGPEGAAIELAIEAGSLNTGNRTRDKHLCSGDFFDVAEHPQVRFKTSTAQPVTGGTLHVVGYLEAAGYLVPLEFPAAVREVAHGLEIEATTAVDQEEFAMSSGLLGMIRRPATLHVRSFVPGAVV